MQSPHQDGGDGSGSMEISWHVLLGNVGDYALITLLVAIIIVSFVGNCLVCIAVFTDRRLRKLGNVFIVSLAIADLFVSCLVMTFALCNDLMNYWMFGDWLCDVWISFDIMCCTASILNLCAISLDRFIHIKDCLLYNQWMTRRVALSALLLIWFISGLVSFVPITLGWHKPDYFVMARGNVGNINATTTTTATISTSSYLGADFMSSDSYKPSLRRGSEKKRKRQVAMVESISGTNYHKPHWDIDTLIGHSGGNQSNNSSSRQEVAKSPLGLANILSASQSSSSTRTLNRADKLANKSIGAQDKLQLLGAHIPVSNYYVASDPRWKRYESPASNSPRKELGSSSSPSSSSDLSQSSNKINSERLKLTRYRPKRQFAPSNVVLKQSRQSINGVSEATITSPSYSTSPSSSSSLLSETNGISLAQQPQCILTLTPTYAIVSSTISFYIPCIIMLGLYTKLFACARKHVRNIQAASRIPIPITASSFESTIGSAGQSMAGVESAFCNRNGNGNQNHRQNNQRRGQQSQGSSSITTTTAQQSIATNATTITSNKSIYFATAASERLERVRSWMRLKHPKLSNGRSIQSSEFACNDYDTSAPTTTTSMAQLDSNDETQSTTKLKRITPIDSIDGLEKLEAQAGDGSGLEQSLTRQISLDDGQANGLNVQPEATSTCRPVGRVADSKNSKLPAMATDSGTFNSSNCHSLDSDVTGMELEQLLSGCRDGDNIQISTNTNANNTNNNCTAKMQANIGQINVSSSPLSGLNDNQQHKLTNRSHPNQQPALASAPATCIANQKASQPSKSQQSGQLATHKAAVTLGIIMGTFLFCWVPFFCLNITKAFCVDCIPSSMFRAFTWLGYANSALNPIIYGIHNSEFRNAFNRIFFKHLNIKSSSHYLNRRFSYDLRHASNRAANRARKSIPVQIHFKEVCQNSDGAKSER